MLTPKQFEAIGRLTLAFNELEYAVREYTPLLIGEKAPRSGFSDKTRFLRKGLIAQDRPGWSAPILEALAKAEELAKKRNGYVHALVIHDFGTNETRLRIQKRESTPRNEIPDPTAIINLSLEAHTLAAHFSVQCENLLTESDNSGAEGF
jgi:hypothetical protein